MVYGSGFGPHKFKFWVELYASWSWGVSFMVAGVGFYTINPAAQEATQGQTDGYFSQLPFKYYLPEVASVGD